MLNTNLILIHVKLVVACLLIALCCGIVQVQAPQADIIVYVGAEWCGPCKRMKGITFKDAEVIRQAKRYKSVWILDYDKSKYGKSYNVRSLPTTLIGRVVDGKWIEMDRVTGYVGAREFARWLSQGDGRPPRGQSPP